MDILAVLGVITGFVALVGGVILKGANPAVLLNPAAAVIILMGTTAAIMNSFPKEEFKRIPKLIGMVFKNQNLPEPEKIIEQIVSLAQLARKEGLLGIEKEVENIEIDLMKRGLSMVIDGADQEHIKELLSIDIESMEERHHSGALVFTSAGSYAPTLGVLGAVVGLIGALGNLNDIEKMGHMIAAAFVATLYGIFLGYVICHPFATRLKRKSHHEVHICRIIAEGVLSIQAGENPTIIKQKLICLLEPKARLAMEDKKPEDKEAE